MNDIERELEFELHRVLDPISRMPIPPRRAPGQTTWLRRLAGGAGGALTIKVLSGVAVAAAAATVATAAATGSLNPAHVSQGISESVETCKANLQAGEHGIGDCVSAIAQHHGSSSSNDKSNHGNAGGDGGSQSQGNGTGHGTPNPPGHNPDKDKGKGQQGGPATPKGK